MKFVHMADVHFDMPMMSLKEKRDLIRKRRIEQKQAFRDVIQLVKKKNIDFLFISGDLFEQKYVEKSTIEYIISNFGLIPETNIFISPGNHDPLIKNSPYSTFEWPENVTIFGSEYGMISFDDVDIYGLGFDNFEFTSNAISEIKIENDNKINILVTHGTLNGNSEKYQDIKEKDLKKFDYVALGHIHNKKIDDSNIIYPGSLISCGFDEPGKHGFVKGEITKEKCNIEFVELPFREFKKIEIDISNIYNMHDVLNSLNLKDDFYKIVFTGVRNFDIDELVNILNETNKNICEICDNTTLPYDFNSIKNMHNLKGVFTKKILDEMENMNEEEKKETFKVIELIYQMMK